LFSAPVNVSRLNFTVLLEHCLQTVVVRALRQTLDEQVEEALLSFGALFLTLMVQNLDLLAVEFECAALCDRQVGSILALKLNVAEASRLSVGEQLELTRADSAKLGEGIIELLLSHLRVNELHDQVGLGLHEVAFLQVAANKIGPNLRVVYFGGAAFSLLHIEKLKEAIAILALRLFVHVDDCLVDVVTQSLHVLV